MQLFGKVSKFPAKRESEWPILADLPFKVNLFRHVIVSTVGSC